MAWEGPATAGERVRTCGNTGLISALLGIVYPVTHRPWLEHTHLPGSETTVAGAGNEYRARRGSAAFQMLTNLLALWVTVALFSCLWPIDSEGSVEELL